MWTIGHSTRTLEEFMSLLRDITLVVDVRKLPGSRRFPWFNDDALAGSLADAGIGYRRVEALTGRRPVSREVPLEVNGWWTNRSFHNYADHALSEPFDAALGDLLDWARTDQIALMCSEAVWWRCHRRIIADHLIARGHQVHHIVGPGKVSNAELSEGAKVDSARAERVRVTYPA